MIMALLSIPMSGCDKYLNNTPLPVNSIAATNVYNSDPTISAVITGLYLNMNNSGPFSGSASGNLEYTFGLYTDELKNLAPGNFGDTYYKEAIAAGNSGEWSNFYARLYTVNSAIEGITGTTAALQYKNQWLGECYFLRAFYYFYLVNIYGDVPLALTTDYTVNNNLTRAPQAQVYQQIVSDLKLAQSLLSTDYRNGFGTSTSDRVRPNQAAATALLARAYLYEKDWKDAEIQATALINNSAYVLVPLNQVFQANSQEQIWALAPNNAGRPPEYSFYNDGIPPVLAVQLPPLPPQTPTSYGVFVELSNFLLKQFEPNDQRATWVYIVTEPTQGTKYYLPNKYNTVSNGAQNLVMIRLAEMYLIRAEARAEQGELNAVDDLNAVRARAGLPGTSAHTPADFLAAVAKERQTELFTECGHRFFDMKRTGVIDSVMNIVAPTKPATWGTFNKYWPIPSQDLIDDPNLTPNPGYLQN